MTKDQELAIIDRAAADLGPDSYLGPWLLSVRAELAAAIRSDLMPAPDLPDAAYRKAEGIVTRAQQTADNIVKHADKLAADQLNNARKEADQIRAYVANELRQAHKRLVGDRW